ncbi:hypothetical protein PHLH5_26880 [Pseudomonas sp. Cab53]|uniref:XAC2610-related protein n=1 Tax=Pseudomonas sp. Cab53 TaxID=2678258 RepID=UPI001BB3AF55|nr:hypothetical protein [Pseudomonas sp. Cab53]BBP65147.1 hypothetical protein PHLH5_26880 [Pseudomonas sp. Cab53]
MRSLVSGVLLSAALVAPVMAEPRSFSVNDRDGQYRVDVLFPNPPEDPEQLAQAFITVRDNNTQAVLQQLQTPAGNVPVDRDGKVNPWLLGPFSLLYFADFNFDGRQDLAIRNGTDPESRYKPMFDVYLQDPNKPQWVLNAALTDLAKQASSGMFSVIALDHILFTQTDRGCCSTRTTQWQMQGDALVRLRSSSEDEVEPSELGDSSSMPSGYKRQTYGELKDGQWHQQTSLSGPDYEDPIMLKGTVGGKVPVDLWYQQQGALMIGEVRYTKGGNGKPIKLAGFMNNDGDDSYAVLQEFADDGRQTGIWRITQGQAEPYDFTGTWISGVKGNDRQMAVMLHGDAGEPDVEASGKVGSAQRSGHYQMRKDAQGHDADLDLKILPERDAEGREVAEFTVTVRDAATAREVLREHQVVPMDADNLIIVRGPQALGDGGPYHIQLLPHFAVISHNEVFESPEDLPGMYLRRQP